MNILVTGSSGFIASHLIPKLESLGHDVIEMDMKGVGGDCSAYGDCLENIIDTEIVIHLASFIDVQESIQKPFVYFQNNLGGLVNMLNASLGNKVKRFIFASSAAADNPQSPYGLTKLCGEQWCDLFTKCYGLSTVSLRFFNVYGKGTNKGVIPLWINKIKKGENPVINGDGEQTRDFVYIDDVVDAIICAMNCDATGVYEVGPGIDISILELCDTLLTEMKSDNSIEFRDALRGELKESCAKDMRRTKKCLGWNPQYLLVRKGIKEMLK